MTDRPRWAKEITIFLSDTIIDEKYGWPPDDSADAITDEIEDAVKAILCRHFGHEIEDDQCGIPEHRYCVWCHKRETRLFPQKNDDVTQRIIRATGNFPDDADVSHVLREPSERVAIALGLDPTMPVSELQRKAPCTCPIMTKAVYRNDIEWDDE